MNTSGGAAPTFYVDDIRLSRASSQLQVTGVALATSPPGGLFRVRSLAVESDDCSNPLEQKVKVRNAGTQPALGPITLVLSGLSSNTSVLNASGLTSNVVPAGDPYVSVTAGSLAPDQRVKVVLSFSNPRPNGEITYTPKVLSDGMVP
jgi:hypothetical protein